MSRLEEMRQRLERPMACSAPGCPNEAKSLREFIRWGRVPGFAFRRWCPNCWDRYRKAGGR